MASNFSVNLSALRKEKGISQSQAAKGLGISQALLSHYERGIRECGLEFLIRAADFYSVSCDYLLGISKNRDGSGGHIYDNDKIDSIFSVLDTIINIVDSSGSKSLKSDVIDYYLYAHYCMLKSIQSQSDTGCGEGGLPDNICMQLAFPNMQSLCASAYCAVNKIKYPGVSFTRRKIDSIDDTDKISDKRQKDCMEVVNYIKEKLGAK